MSLTPEERVFIARAALLEAESAALVDVYNAHVEQFMRDCPIERLEQIGRDNPDEVRAITLATPSTGQLIMLDSIIARLRDFSDMPSEDRGYVATCFMQLHDTRDLLLRGFFLRAMQEADAVATRLHWVARERKRNNVRAAHRLPAPSQLDELERISREVETWGKRLRKPVKVVA